MRTAPVALARLGDDKAIADLAVQVSLLTQGDPLAAEGCVLWCIAIDRAVREQRLDVRAGLPLLPVDRRRVWAEAIDLADVAHTSSPTCILSTTSPCDATRR